MAVVVALGIGLPKSLAAPNIVHILADDLGWGGVGFNGQAFIQTPNLDALAAGGLNFSNAYAATVCGSSRAMLYSGYHNGHTLVDRNQNLDGLNQAFRADGETIGAYLQTAGYHTALFGKSGFGGGSTSGSGLSPNPWVDDPASIPTQQGFEDFYGYLDHARARSYQVDSLWTTTEPVDDNQNGMEEVGEKYQANSDNGLWLEKTGNCFSDWNVNHTSDLMADKTVEYIQSHANGANPFYVEHASTLPHFDIDSIANIDGWFDAYVDPNTGAEIVPGASSWTGKEQKYAAMITKLDDQVGRIIASLQDPDGDGNTSDSVMAETLILFTADNGGTKEDSSPIDSLDANGKRGYKRDIYDGGINVPMLAHWEGTIAGGQESDQYVALEDFMPTVLELVGVEGRVGMDGESYAYELNGQGINRRRDHWVFEHHEGGELWGIIKDDYKLISWSDGSYSLFDLVDDPQETTNLLNAHPGVWNSLRDEYINIALTESVLESDSYTVEFQDWTGSDGDNINDAANWSGTTPAAITPNLRWSAVINNTTSTAAVAHADASTAVLGFDVQGDGALQTVRTNRFTTLTGRNEVRISHGGRIHLDQATLSTVRWVDIKNGGQLTGHGTLEGAVYNWGTISPGLPDDLGPPNALPGPPEIPCGVDTDAVTAVDFNFIGQSQSPISDTLVQSPWLEVVHGVDYGPGVSEKNDFTNAGDELNVRDWTVDGSQSSGLANNDYVHFTVKPVDGIEVLMDSVSFQLWRNGSNAPEQYAIHTTLDGFDVGDELGSWSLADGDASTHVFTANYTGGQWTQGELEVRLYGWQAGNSSGNTHITGAAMTACFRSLGGADVALDPTGQLTLDGDFWHVSGGKIEIDLGGTDISNPLNPQYDRLVVTGDVEVAGDLGISLVDGFHPVAGDSFDILDWGTLTGEFGNITLPDLDAELAWDTSTLLTDGVLSVVVSLSLEGDYDRDGSVRQGDLDLVLLNWGRVSPPVPFGWVNDPPHGQVSQTQLDKVLLNWGNTSSESALAGSVVPEPSLAFLFSLPGLLLTRRRSNEN